MKRVYLTKMDKRISEVFWYSGEKSKQIIDFIIWEIEFEIIQWNRIIIPWIVAMNKVEAPRKTMFNTRTNKVEPVKNKYAIKLSLSEHLRNKINFIPSK